jgi:pimeloyl-ACP methyl ester carboxylesterase
MRLARIGLLAAALALACPVATTDPAMAAGQTQPSGTASPDEERITLDTRPGISLSFLLTQPPSGKPVASVILFTGSEGRLYLDRYGSQWRNGNFLIRSRALFAAAGFLVAAPDTPSDQDGGYDKGFRGSDAHATDIAALIAYLRRRQAIPVWLIGTSAGTLSALDGAVLPPGRGADGLVLTSTVTRHIGASMAADDYPLTRINLPTLIVSHRDDACKVTPATDAPALAAKLDHAPKVEVRIVEGGDTPRGDPCLPFHHHGYIGNEREVVSMIADWIKATPLKPQ